MGEARQDRGGGAGAPSGQAREAVGGVADQRQVVGDRSRWNAPLLVHAGLVDGQAAAPVPQDDAVAAHALGKVLVRGADPDAFDIPPACPSGRCRSQGVVRLELDHRPHGHAESLHRPLGERELVQQLGRDAGLGLVAGVQLVAERSDDVVGGAADVRGPFVAEERQQGVEQAHDRPYIASVAGSYGRPR